MDKTKIKEMVSKDYHVINEKEDNAMTFAKDPDYIVEIYGSTSENKGLIMCLYKKGILLDKAVNVKTNEIMSIISLFEKGIQKDFYYYPSN